MKQAQPDSGGTVGASLWGLRRPSGPLPKNYRWIALTNTTIGAFMSSLDASILTVSLPTVARDLHIGVALMLWILMGYTVVLTALLLPIGRLADLHGRVRFYLLGFIIFTIGSAFSGMAMTGVMLLMGRLVQGVGASLVWSNSMAILTDAFPPRQRGLALGINQVAALSGSLGGLLLGGIITMTLGWRWIFFVNLPIGTFGAIWTYYGLRELGQRGKPEPFDYAGLATVIGGVVSILLALTEVVQGDTGPIVPGLLVLGLSLLALFLFLERRTPSPLLDLGLFAERAFSFGNAALFMNALAQGALMFLLTFAFQGMLGASPLRAGLLLFPFTGSVLLVAPVSGAVSDRVGPRWLASGGLLVAAVAFFALSGVPVTGPYLPIAVGMIFAGFGTGLFNSPNTSAIMSAVPAARRGVAAAIRSFLFNSGQVLSIALAFSVVSTTMGASHLTAFMSGAAANSSSAEAGAFGRGLHIALLLSAALSGGGAILSFLRSGRTHATGSRARTDWESATAP